jgi:ATP-dependent RNA helicase DHX36
MHIYFSFTFLQEARALLGRLEYQRGHVEAALRVFDGIDISSLVPKMKISIARKAHRRKTRSQWDSPPMPLHAVSLLMEAIYLKARALHDLGKFKGNSHLSVTQINNRQTHVCAHKRFAF